MNTQKITGVILTNLLGLLLATFIVTTNVQASEIHISPPIATTAPLIMTYPEKVYKMTDAEFYVWATKRNQEAWAVWKLWRATAPPKWITHGWTLKHKGSQYGEYFGSNRSESSYRLYQPRCLNPDYQTKSLTIINPYVKPKRN